jgi:hypothetical protein
MNACSHLARISAEASNYPETNNKYLPKLAQRKEWVHSYRQTVLAPVVAELSAKNSGNKSTQLFL